MVEFKLEGIDEIEEWAAEQYLAHMTEAEENVRSAFRKKEQEPVNVDEE